MAKILLTEDHLDTAKMMAMVLERHGFVVRLASNVAQALEAARKEAFDLCICDFRLPDGDGAKLSRQLLEEHGLKSICLSGDVDVTELQNDPQTGFVACLSKPIDIDGAVRTIRAAVAAK